MRDRRISIAGSSVLKLTEEVGVSNKPLVGGGAAPRLTATWK